MRAHFGHSAFKARLFRLRQGSFQQRAASLIPETRSNVCWMFRSKNVSMLDRCYIFASISCCCCRSVTTKKQLSSYFTELALFLLPQSLYFTHINNSDNHSLLSRDGNSESSKPTILIIILKHETNFQFPAQAD